MKYNNFSTKKYYLLFTLYFLGFGILIAVIVSYVNYKSSFVVTENKLKEIANSEMKNKRNFLYRYISNTEMLLSSIVKNDLTLKYVKSKNDINKKNLNNLFYALASSNKNIMQLRYLDASGKEKIRIDRNKISHDLIVVPEKKLQNKKSRYYFKEASMLMSNQFWHSNIDLNVENGKIENPLKPTFRVATQLVIENEYKGIVIANLLFNDTIDILSQSTIFNIYLADKDGEIIHSPNNVDSWSKYLENKHSLKNIFPENADNILTQKNFNTKEIYSYSLSDLFKNQENLKIIFNAKQNALKTMEDKNTLAALIIALTVLVVSIPLSWIVSIIPSKLQMKLTKSYEEIRKNSEIIDKYVMISKTDKTGIIKDISKKFTYITGYELHEIIGKNHSFLKHNNTSEQIYQNLWKTISNGKVWEHEIQDIDKHGNEFWINIVITPEFNQIGEIEGYTAISQDITDKKLIEHISITDPLTKLFNRRKIDTTIEEEVARFNRYATDFSILFIDIDKFKKINDNFGHEIGDNILIELSKILKTNSRIIDSVGRWGGEEFIIICSQTDINGAFEFASHIRKKVDDYNFPEVGKVTISCGVTQYLDNDSIKNFISRADNALYKAKANGRNRVIRG